MFRLSAYAAFDQLTGFGGDTAGFPSCGRPCQYGPGLGSASATLTAWILLWGSLCHQVKREASRFISSTRRKNRIKAVVDALEEAQFVVPDGKET